MNRKKNNFWGYWSLHGILGELAELASSGHYTWGVNISGRWFIISDAFVVSTRKINTTYRQMDLATPYSILHKKTTNNISYSDNVREGL